MKLAVVAAALVSTVTVADASQWKAKLPLPACVEQDDTMKAFGMLADGDKEAAVKFLAAKAVFGQCTMFAKDEMLLGRSAGVFSGFVKLRRKGDPEEYIVPINAVELVGE